MPRLIHPKKAGRPRVRRADPAGRWTWSCAQRTSFTGPPEARGLGAGWPDAVHLEIRPAEEANRIVGGACGTERPLPRLRRVGGAAVAPGIPGSPTWPVAVAPLSKGWEP